MLSSIQTTLLLSIEQQGALYKQSYLHDWKHFHTYYNTDDTQKLQEGLRSLFAPFGVSPLHLDDHSMLFSTNPSSSTRLHPASNYSLLICCQYQKLSVFLPLLFSWLTTLAAFDANQLPLTLTWLLTDDSSDSALSALISRHAAALQADACLCYTLDPVNGYKNSTSAPLLICGTKGYLRTQLMLQSALAPIPAIHGSVVPDAAWRLVWALHSLKDAHEEVLIDGFYDNLVPLEDEAVELLHQLSPDATALTQIWGLPHPLLGLQGFQFHYAHLLTPSCTIRSIATSHYTPSFPADTHDMSSTATTAHPAPPFIPHQAQAELDFYLLPGQDPTDIFTRLQPHLSSQGFPDVQAHLLSASIPTYTSVNHPLIQNLLQATTDAYGEAPIILPIAPAPISLAPLYQQLHIPTVVIANHTPPPSTQLDIITPAKQLALLLTGMMNL